MKSFSSFNQEFSQWVKLNNISYTNYIKYFWIIPTSASELWVHELDEFKDYFSQEILQNFINQFTPGNSLLGIYNAFLDPNSSSVKLYELSSNLIEFSIDNILVSKTIHLPVQSNPINVDGNSINIPYFIQKGTVNIMSPQGTVDLIDSSNNISRGSLLGLGFLNFLRDENTLDSNSLLASIDYQKGILHLIRNNDSNESKFIKYYKWLREEINHSNSHFCKSNSEENDGKDNNSDNEDSEDSTFHSLYSLSQINPYEYMSISGSFYSLGSPVNLIFEFDCNSQDSDFQPSDEYLSLVDYPNQQEILINQIKASIQSSLDTQQEILNQHTGNFDFQLGTTF